VYKGIKLAVYAEGSGQHTSLNSCGFRVNTWIEPGYRGGGNTKRKIEVKTSLAEPKMEASKYLPSASAVTLCITVVNLVMTTFSLVILPYVTNVSSVAPLLAGYRVYLHVANIINVFGIIGVLRLQISTMMAYAAWLYIDAILSVIPRLAILWIMSSISITLCTGAPVPISLLQGHSSENANSNQIVKAGRGWNSSGCERTVSMTELATEVALVGLMVIQLFAANMVRHFAKKLSLSRVSVGTDGDVEAAAGEKDMFIITETKGAGYDDNKEAEGEKFPGDVLGSHIAVAPPGTALGS